jgi:hypothetical protein
VTVAAWGAAIFDNGRRLVALYGRVQITAEGCTVTSEDGPTPVVAEVPQHRMVCVVRGDEGDRLVRSVVDGIVGDRRPPGMGDPPGKSPFRDPPVVGLW